MLLISTSIRSDKDPRVVGVGRREASQGRADSVELASPGWPRGQRMQAALQLTYVTAADEVLHCHVGACPYVLLNIDDLSVAAYGPEV